MSDKFPFYPRDLVSGCNQGVGLCTLWTPKNKYTDQRPYVEVIGNLYSRFGIGIMIRNVLATPSIHSIVITGVDNPEAKERQADNIIKGLFDPSALFLELDHVHEFYKRISFYDARHISLKNQKDLSKLLQDIPEKDTRDLESIYIPLPEIVQDVFKSARSGHSIRDNSIKSAHYRILKELRTFGEFTSPDNEGHQRQELWQLSVTLSSDCTYCNIPHYDDDQIINYGNSLWQGDEPEEMTYRYGHTLRSKYGDQIEESLNIFRKKPETFRTVLTLWEPLHSMRRDDEPCLTTVHPRIRNGILDMYAYIRTNEMFRAWPKNAAGLRYLQSKFAESLDVRIGELTITSGSAHIYDYDWQSVDNYLNSNKSPGFIFDPKGDWRLAYQDGEYLAEHYVDRQLVQILKEKDLNTLEKRILPFISDVSHALYIGRELQKLNER